MGWLVLNWGEGWVAFGMGRIDRWCTALGNSNGLVTSALLESHAAVDFFFGHTSLEFGTVGSGFGQLLRSRLHTRWVPWFGAVLRF